MSVNSNPPCSQLMPYSSGYAGIIEKMAHTKKEEKMERNEKK